MRACVFGARLAQRKPYDKRRYYQKPSTIQDLVDFLKPITAAAPKLPFWYYHIPGDECAVHRVGYRKLIGWAATHVHTRNDRGQLRHV